MTIRNHHGRALGAATTIALATNGVVLGDATYEVVDTLIEISGSGFCDVSYPSSPSYSFHPSGVAHTPVVFDSLDAAPIDASNGATDDLGGKTGSRVVFEVEQTDTTMDLLLGGRVHASMPTDEPGHYVANMTVQGHIDLAIDQPTMLFQETCIHSTEFYSNGILEIRRLTSNGEEPLDTFQGYCASVVLCQDEMIELEAGEYRLSFFTVASAASNANSPEPKSLLTLIETQLEFIPLPKPGDVTGDGVVDEADLARVLGSYGTSASGADLNDDGIVNRADVAIVLANWD